MASSSWVFLFCLRGDQRLAAGDFKHLAPRALRTSLTNFFKRTIKAQQFYYLLFKV